jgi:hypothetical protein
MLRRNESGHNTNKTWSGSEREIAINVSPTNESVLNKTKPAGYAESQVFEANNKRIDRPAVVCLPIVHSIKNYDERNREESIIQICIRGHAGPEMGLEYQGCDSNPCGRQCGRQ